MEINIIADGRTGANRNYFVVTVQSLWGELVELGLGMAGTGSGDYVI